MCCQLGYGKIGLARSTAAFGTGLDPISLDEVTCSGSESNIEVCSSTGWGEQHCGHSEDAGVYCGSGNT